VAGYKVVNAPEIESSTSGFGRGEGSLENDCASMAEECAFVKHVRLGKRESKACSWFMASISPGRGF